MEPVEPVQINIYQSNTCRKDLSWLHFDNVSKIQDRPNSPACSLLQQIQQFRVAIRSTRPDTTTVFYAWPHGRFIEIQSNLQRKKFHRTRQGPHSFSNRDNVRAPTWFGRESQTQYLKRWFFFKNRPIRFHFNSTSVIRPIKQNKLSHWNQHATSWPSQQFLVDHIQVHKPIQVVATGQMPDHI